MDNNFIKVFSEKDNRDKVDHEEVLSGLRLMRAFRQISNKAKRVSIIEMVENIAAEADETRLQF